jgi:hypothetical protein
MPHDTQPETSRAIPHYWAWLAALGLAVTVATGEARQLLNGRRVSLPIKEGIHLTFSRAGMSSK